MPRKKQVFGCSHAGGKILRSEKLFRYMRKIYSSENILRPEELLRTMRKIRSSHCSNSEKLKAIKILTLQQNKLMQISGGDFIHRLTQVREKELRKKFAKQRREIKKTRCLTSESIRTQRRLATR